MNRHIMRLGLFILAISLILSGCSKGDQEDKDKLPADPVEALKEINKAAQEMKSAHMTALMSMDMDLQSMEMTVEINMEGDIEMEGPSPEDANMYLEMEMSMLGQKIKMEMIGLDGKYWMRQEDQDWETMPAGAVNMPGGIDPTSMLGYLENAKNVKRLDDESVDGIESYHFSYTMDSDALGTQEMVGQITGSAELTDEQAQKILETAVLEAEVWVAKSDLLPRRQVIHMTFEVDGLPELEDVTVKYDMQIDIQLSEINEPVEITAPTD